MTHPIKNTANKPLLDDKGNLPSREELKEFNRLIKAINRKEITSEHAKLELSRLWNI